MDRLTIGAVSRLTSIPTHTLRKWESRHEIVQPLRSESGRRFYTEDHVARLSEVKALMAEGHALSELAKLDTPELSSLRERHQKNAKPCLLSHIDIVGVQLAGKIKQKRGGFGKQVQIFPMAVSDWLNDPVTNTESPEGSALLIECDTLPTKVIDALAGLRQNRYDRVVVVYTFAPRSIENELGNRGIKALKAPATIEQMKSALSNDQSVLPLVSFNLEAPEFSTEQLTKIANYLPSLHCECPNHIAQLLIEVNAFEEYCQLCIKKDPGQKAIHTELSKMTAQSRAIFETALKAVAIADGIDLNEVLAEEELSSSAG